MESSLNAIRCDQKFQRLIEGIEEREKEFLETQEDNIESFSVNEFLNYLPFVILLEHESISSSSKSKELFFRKIRDAKNDPELVYYGSFFKFRITALTRMINADFERLNQVGKENFVAVSEKCKERQELREQITEKRDEFLARRLVNTVVSALYSHGNDGRYNQTDIKNVVSFLEGKGEKSVTIHDDDSTGTIFFKIADMGLFVDYMTQYVPIVEELYLANFKEICDVQKLVDYLKARPEANTLKVGISVELSEASQKIFEDSGLNIVYYSPKYPEDGFLEVDPTEEPQKEERKSGSSSMEYRESSEESGDSSHQQKPT